MAFLGDAWASWATAAGLDVRGVPLELRLRVACGPWTLEELEAQIGTDFAPIKTDGWKRPFEFRVAQGGGVVSLAIRSVGRDGVWLTAPYQAGSFVPPDYDQGIVWINGSSVRWPAYGSPTKP